MNQPTLDFIHLHAADDVRQLALGSAPAGVDLRAALRQIEGRQLAARKLPSWAANDGLLFPRRLSLEQCSSEATALYKRQLVAGLLRPEDGAAASFADLTAGFGVDFAALAPLFAQALYVDRDPDLCELARHNLSCLGITHAQVLAASAEDVLDALLDHSSFLKGQASKLERVTPHSSFLKGQASKLERVIRHSSFLKGQASKLERVILEGSSEQARARHSSFLKGQASKLERFILHSSFFILHSPLSLVMLDPARRDAAGRKVALIEDCTPDVCALQGRLRSVARLTLIKLSPMLDLTAALRSLHAIVGAHIVSVGGECKELLLLMRGEGASSLSAPSSLDDVPISCVDLPSQLAADEDLAEPFLFTRAEEAAAPAPLYPEPAALASAEGLYLYEPSASLLKAGAFRLLGQRYPVQKLAPQSHLYVSRLPVDDFPGRAWRVLRASSFAKRDLRRFLADIPAAELSVRGFPASVATLRRQLHLREGGTAHLIATTLADNSRMLLEVERVGKAQI